MSGETSIICPCGSIYHDRGECPADQVRAELVTLRAQLVAVTAELETMRGERVMMSIAVEAGAEALSVLRELVEALPRCDYGLCENLAMIQDDSSHDHEVYCDAHGPGCDMKYTAPLRRALALIGGGA